MMGYNAMLIPPPHVPVTRPSLQKQHATHLSLNVCSLPLPLVGRSSLKVRRKAGVHRGLLHISPSIEAN